MAHGDCLVLLPCVTRGEAEAHRCCGLPEFSQGVRGHSWPPAQDVHYARFWTGWSPVGSRTRGPQRQTDWRALGDRSCGQWPRGLQRKAARDLHRGSLLLTPWSPAAPKRSGPVASWSPASRWGFSGKPTALCLSLQWKNPTLTVPLTPACLAGAKPTAFPKGQCRCCTSRPLWRV